MTDNTNYPHGSPPSDFREWTSLNRWLRNFWDAFNNVRRGKTDNVTEITLAANAASTTLEHPLLAPESFVDFDPQTANAAAELGAGTLYVAAADRGAGSWELTHANNANADRTFKVVIVGG